MRPDTTGRVNQESFWGGTRGNAVPIVKVSEETHRNGAVKRQRNFCWSECEFISHSLDHHMLWNEYKTTNRLLFSTRYILLLLTNFNYCQIEGNCCLCNDKGLNWNQPSISTLLSSQCGHSKDTRFSLDSNSYIYTYIHIQGGPEKTAQTLMRYNFSTAGHRVSRFPAKCSETNW